MDSLDNKAEFNQIWSYMDYSIHEMPCGVLYDENGANEQQCQDLMKDTYRLEELAKILDEDADEFIAFCRWHYERYPHYLSRQKHFGTYGQYIVKYGGPLQFKA
jgi:hypothetical protein